MPVFSVSSTDLMMTQASAQHNGKQLSSEITGNRTDRESFSISDPKKYLENQGGVID